MLTLIILLLITVIGILTLYYSLNESIGFGVLHTFAIVIFGIWLIVHSISLATVEYNYEMYLVKRNAFEQTLKNTRANGNPYETAAIVESVAYWNESLAKYQFQNKTFYYNQFIDNRFNNLLPIQ